MPLREIRREARAAIYGYPEAKILAKEATNADPWGPTEQQKSQLAHLARNHSEDRRIILRALWKRLATTNEYWQHPAKALDCLEYLYVAGVPDISEEILGNLSLISELRNYNAADDAEEKERDRHNENVRLKAQSLLNLTRDPELLTHKRIQHEIAARRLSGETVPDAAMLPRELPRREHPQREARRRSHDEPEEANTELVEMLVAMGFTDTDAVIAALVTTDNNVNESITLLLEDLEKGAHDGPDTSGRSPQATTKAPALLEFSSPLDLNTPQQQSKESKGPPQGTGAQKPPEPQAQRPMQKKQLSDLLGSPVHDEQPKPRQSPLDLFATAMPATGAPQLRRSPPRAAAASAAQPVRPVAEAGMYGQPAFDPFAPLAVPQTTPLRHSCSGSRPSGEQPIDFFAAKSRSPSTNQPSNSGGTPPVPRDANPGETAAPPQAALDLFFTAPATSQQPPPKAATMQEKLMAEYYNKGPLPAPKPTTLEDLMRGSKGP